MVKVRDTEELALTVQMIFIFLINNLNIRHLILSFYVFCILQNQVRKWMI